jgi:hypothetical protein
MPLPRPDDDHEIELKKSYFADDPDDAHTLGFQDTMSKLVVGESDLGEAGQGQPKFANTLETKQEAIPMPVKQKVKGRVGRPRKQTPMPADPEEICGRIPMTETEPGQFALPERLPPAPKSSTPTVSPMQPTALMALESECQRAMVAGMEYQRRQAAQAFLGAVVTNAYSLDEATATAVLTWARAVQKGLTLIDPVAAVISEIRATVGVLRTNDRLTNGPIGPNSAVKLPTGEDMARPVDVPKPRQE